MSEDKTGYTANKNAQKSEEPATSHIHARVTPSDKAGWVKAAQREDMKLTAWITKTLNAATSKKH